MVKPERQEQGDEEGQRLFEQTIDRMMSTPSKPVRGAKLGKSPRVEPPPTKDEAERLDAKPS